MERQEKASRRAGLLLVVLLCFGFWACVLLALSSLANAAEYTPPTTPFTNPSFGVTLPEFKNPNSISSCIQEYESTSTPTEEFLFNIQLNSYQTCRLVGESDKKLGERLFWLTDELIKLREKVELLHTDLGAEGTLAKDLAQLHTDLTATEGLPVRWKSQAVEPEVKFKTTQPVSLASLPELAAGTKAIGTVKVTTLEGEPAIKVGNEPSVKVASLPELHAGTKAIGTVKVTTLEGEPAIKVGNEPSVKVASLPELHAGTKAIGSVEVSNPTAVTGVEAALSRDSETANQNLWALAGVFVGFGLLLILWRFLRP